MEVLPGIAQVLRSPVADAIVNLIRAACRVREFDLADAEEMLRYAVRRNLMGADESERVLAEAQSIVQKRAEAGAGKASECWRRQSGSCRGGLSGRRSASIRRNRFRSPSRRLGSSRR